MIKEFSYKSIVSLVYLIAVMMEIIDVTIVNVALPQIRGILHAPVNLMSWITNGYVLSLATAIPISSWFGERYGTKKVFIIGITFFTLSSILCGFANEIHFLIFARILQGIGGGMLVPVGQTILFRSFEPHEIPALLSKLSIPLTLAPAVGQTLGGLIVEYFSWHWIFWVNIPFGIFCLFMSNKYLLESEKNKNRLDYIGLFICSLGIFFLFYSFSIIDFQSTFTKPIIFFVVSCALLFLFVVFEKKQSNPFFNLNVFLNSNFSLSIICNLLIFSNIMGTFFISNFVFQETIGWSALESGLLAVPFSVGFLISLKLLPRVYPKKIKMMTLLVISNIVCILSGICMNFIYGKEQFDFLFFISFLRGASFGFLIIVLQSAGIMGIKKEMMGDASTIITLTRYAFIGFGTAVFVVLTVVFMNFYHIYPISFSKNPNDVIKIFHWLFNISTVFLIISFLFMIKLKDDNPL